MEAAVREMFGLGKKILVKDKAGPKCLETVFM